MHVCILGFERRVSDDSGFDCDPGTWFLKIAWCERFGICAFHFSKTLSQLSCYICTCSHLLLLEKFHTDTNVRSLRGESNGLLTLSTFDQFLIASLTLCTCAVSFLIFYSFSISLYSSLFFFFSDVSGGKTCWADPQFRIGSEAEGEFSTQAQHTATQQRHAVSAATQPRLA